MRRIAILFATAALVATAATTAAVAQGASSAKKTTICHRANSHKYVALTVSNKALKTHLAHHQDMIGPPVPQNNIKAARAFCAALPVLTPKQGGRKLTASFSNTLSGVTAHLDVRLRAGQGQLCFNLDVTGATVSAATTTSEERIRLITNGVPAAEPAEVPVLPRALVAGRVTPEKGTAAANAAARRSGLKPVLAGTVYDRGYWEREVGVPVLAVYRPELWRLMAGSWA